MKNKMAESRNILETVVFSIRLNSPKSQKNIVFDFLPCKIYSQLKP